MNFTYKLFTLRFLTAMNENKAPIS